MYGITSWMQKNTWNWIRGNPNSLMSTVIGGLGSDNFIITGDVTETIISAELDGRSATINHSVESVDESYDDLLVPGIGLNIADAKSGKVIISESGGLTAVGEDVDGWVDSYTMSNPLHENSSSVIVVIS